MAEFRKYLYALGLAALLAGTSSQAFAQGNTTTCTATAGVIPVIREEGFAELVGDYILDCVGGTKTPAGQAVQRIDVTLTLSANVTSRLLTTALPTSNFNEALLIMDEPNSPINPTRPLRACGAPGSPDQNAGFGGLGDGICAIVATADPRETYDGAGNIQDLTPCDGVNGNPAANSFGCGRPNVFQGRQGTFSAANQVVFNGVPFDPPGVNVPNPVEGLPPINHHRILRFTNIRVAAPAAVSGGLLTAVVVSISINASTAISLPVNIQTVANVQRGLQPVTTSGRFDYVQCIQPDHPPYSTVGFREGFVAAWKTKGLEQMYANGDLTTYSWLGTAADTSATTGGAGTQRLNQNVPGALYFTESGFVSTNLSGWSNPVPNPPLGIGTTAVTGGTALVNRNSINVAGIATQGTRIAVTFRDVPAGLTVSVPNAVLLTRTDNPSVNSGVALRVLNPNANGSGGTLAAANFSYAAISGNLAVYEIMYTDPTRQEDMSINVMVSYTPNLASNLPEPGKTAQVAGGFAPYILSTDSVTTWSTSSPTLPVPRFRSSGAFADLFRINKCACNLLFPFVTNAATPNGNYDTGIAIANTSKQPSAAEGFSTAIQAQAGGVQFWYYTADGADTIPTQCTNTSSPGTCPGTPQLVPAGDVLTYILSQGSTRWGLDNRGAGFTGYIIAQTGFQYCHAFAYISPQGALPLTNGMSVGYLGLILDKNNSLPQRTAQQGEVLAH